MILRDLLDKIDFLVSQSSGLSIYPQDDTENGTEDIYLEYDDGVLHKVLPPETPVEYNGEGIFVIDEVAYRTYVTHMYKPEQE